MSVWEERFLSEDTVQVVMPQSHARAYLNWLKSHGLSVFKMPDFEREPGDDSDLPTYGIQLPK